MANEWVVVELTNSNGNPRRFTVADGTAITRGTLMKLTDPRTAIAADATSAAGASPLAGVAAEDKSASNGITDLTCWTDGIFEAVTSGAITLGRAFVGLTGNKVEEATSATTVASGAILGGYVLETASAGETVNVRLRL